LNRRPHDYKSSALPAELRRLNYSTASSGVTSKKIYQPRHQKGNQDL